MLNSKARRDKCGVCGGDNSSCRTLAGVFNSAHYGKLRMSFSFLFGSNTGVYNVEIIVMARYGFIYFVT